MAKQKKHESNSDNAKDSAESANPAGESDGGAAGEAKASLENMSLEELRVYLAERERREAGGRSQSQSSPSGKASGGGASSPSARPRESIAANFDAPRIPCVGSLVYPGLADFSVREALTAKRIRRSLAKFAALSPGGSSR